MKHGTGKFTYEDGKTYEWSWYEDKQEGCT